MTRAELETLINAGDLKACLNLLDGMPEADRAKLGAAAVARLKAIVKGVAPRHFRFLERGDDFPLPDTLTVRPSRDIQAKSDVPRNFKSFDTARAAVLATASLSQWKSVRGYGLPSDELVLRIMRHRRVTWLNEMVEVIWESDDPFNSRWNLIRGLVREGLCAPPKSGRYIDQMLRVLINDSSDTKRGLKAILLDDPGLLEHEIWRIFETEPSPNATGLLATGDESGAPGTAWKVALVELTNQGRISRERLLDATIDGLSRDLHNLRARWFVILHDQLEPTSEELAARVMRYLDLLGSRNPSTVAFALPVVRKLVKAGRLEPSSLVDRLAPILHLTTKAMVKQALTLLDHAAAQAGDSQEKDRIAAIAAEALVHESADIQEATLDLIERHGDVHSRTIRELLATRVEALNPSLRGRLEAWLAQATVKSGSKQTRPEPPPRESADKELTELKRRAAELDPRLAKLAGVPSALECLHVGRFDLPALNFDGTEFARLDPERRLEPIVDLDALIDLCSRLIENPEPTEDLDRCVDAISRLCDQRPSDFEKRAAPLTARVKNRMDGAGFRELTRHSLASFRRIALAWLIGEIDRSGYMNWSKGFLGFTSVWVRANARRIAEGRAAPLLATPTHSGGWIDPRVFVERYRTRCSFPFPILAEDLIMALLRLAPDRRGEALAAARDLRDEPGAAIRYALGSENEPIGDSAPLWVAAARSRSPWSDDPAVEARHPGLGPDAGQAAIFDLGAFNIVGVDEPVLKITLVPELSEKAAERADLPTVSFHADSFFVKSDQWPSPATIWPSALESFFADGSKRIVRLGDHVKDGPKCREFLTPLLEPDVPLMPMARLLIAVGLHAKLPELAGLATDVAIAAIDDGRIDAAQLGESLRTVWRWEAARSTREPSRGGKSAGSSVGFAKSNRWAKSLGDVIRASSLHAHVVACALEQVLADKVTGRRASASVVPLLELLREASVTCGRAVSAEVRAYLKKIGTSGKTGRVVKSLLELQDVPDLAKKRVLAVQALEHRIMRAERWGRKTQFAVPSAVARRASGDEGPGLEIDFDANESLAGESQQALIKGIVEAVSKDQLKLLGDHQPCPTCGRSCSVTTAPRNIRARGGTVAYDEPVCHCPDCHRDFVPSTS
jgi:Family of unknown function (DUF6493)